MKKAKQNRRNKKVFSAVAVAGMLSLGMSPAWAQSGQAGATGAGQQAKQAQRADALIAATSLMDTQVIDHQNREVGRLNNLFIDPDTGTITRADIEFDTGLFGAGQRYSIEWDNVEVKQHNGQMVLAVDQSIVQRVEQARDRDLAATRPGVGAPATAPRKDGTVQQQDQLAQQPQQDRGDGILGMGRDDQRDRQPIAAAQLRPEQIREVQQHLNKEGFHAGPVDGKWDERTQSAVRNFQQAKGLQVTGQLDERTLDELGLDADEFRQDRQQQMKNGGGTGGGAR